MSENEQAGSAPETNQEQQDQSVTTVSGSQERALRGRTIPTRAIFPYVIRGERTEPSERDIAYWIQRGMTRPTHPVLPYVIQHGRTGPSPRGVPYWIQRGRTRPFQRGVPYWIRRGRTRPLQPAVPYWIRRRRTLRDIERIAVRRHLLLQNFNQLLNDNNRRSPENLISNYSSQNNTASGFNFPLPYPMFLAHQNNNESLYEDNGRGPENLRSNDSSQNNTAGGFDFRDTEVPEFRSPYIRRGQDQNDEQRNQNQNGNASRGRGRRRRTIGRNIRAIRRTLQSMNTSMMQTVENIEAIRSLMLEHDSTAEENDARNEQGETDR